MLPSFRPLAASLVFCLSATVFASPASAWRIGAALNREGGIGGPSDFEDTFSGPGDKIVNVAQSDGYPDNSEISGSARVDLATGAMRGNAHAVAIASPNSQHEIRFIAILEEDIRITYPSALPLADRIVRLRANVSAGFAATNAASATGFFSITVNGRRSGANFGTDTTGGWSIPGGDPGWTSMRTAGGAEFVFTPLVAGERDLELDVQLDGTAIARGIFMQGNGFADVNALNTAYLELILPAGATFTSGSGVFLTEPIPEPGTAALLLAGAFILAARGRRERSLG